MIDFHSHILPGIDDGSQNIEESRQLLAAESEDGVTTIIATPHFHADSISGKKYLEKRAESEAELRSILACASLPRDFRTETGIPATRDFSSEVAAMTALEVRVGAEVYYFPGIARADILDDLCIQGTKTLMVEMPFTQWTESHYKDIRDLVYKRRFQVILAHVERYIYFQKKKDVWNAVMDLPLTKQLNAGSFIKKSFFDRTPRWSMNFLKEHEDVVIGSDCHNMTNRKPNLLAGRRAIKRTLGPDRLKQIDASGESLLRGSGE